ncbi:MAG: LiaF-related protein [Candidatus Electryonea clarkiae]|nr:LiaF-related protein [Candidatus Electryonea clarkiae]MDP8288733.1 LiaF-related protein [Candidatus Electryonea clarkiae]
MFYNITTELKFAFVALLGICFLSSTLEARDYQSKKLIEELGSVKSAEIQIELGLAEVDIKPGVSNQLISLDAYYDLDYVDPVLEVERDGDHAYILIKTNDLKKFKNRNNSEDKYSIKLSPSPELNLMLEIGLGDNELDLSNLKIKRLSVEAGLSGTSLVVENPNQVRADRITIESGLGEFSSDHLGFLRFDRFDFSGGLGSAEVDLRGFEGEADVNLEVGLGSIELILPRNVGVRLDYEESFLSSVDFEDFEKVGKGRYESEGYDQKQHHLYIDLSVGLGSADIRWKN